MIQQRRVAGERFALVSSFVIHPSSLIRSGAPEAGSLHRRVRPLVTHLSCKRHTFWVLDSAR